MSCCDTNSFQLSRRRKRYPPHRVRQERAVSWPQHRRIRTGWADPAGTLERGAHDRLAVADATGMSGSGWTGSATGT